MNEPTNNALRMFAGSPGEPVRENFNERLEFSKIVDACCAPLKTYTLEEPLLLERTKNLRHSGETVLAFIARTGCSLDQLRRLTESEIRHFCEVVERNRVDDVSAPAPAFF